LTAPVPVRERLGATHTSGCYHVREGSFTVAGARDIERFGSSLIKLWFDSELDRHYGHGDAWPPITSFLDLASAPLYEEVFGMSFSTIVLEAFRPGRLGDYYLREGMTAQDEADEAAAFRELTVHLRQRWNGTGKTFVLQNWEGDWAVRGHFERDTDPTPEALDAFRRWMGARQRGVEEGRAAIPDSDVKVWNAAEANLVERAMDGHPSLVTDVFPKVRCDLYSYSCWDPWGAGGRLKERLDFIARHCPPSEAFGSKNVFLGEFGAPENFLGEAEAARITATAARQALEWGCPYVIFWEVYDNECDRNPKGCPGYWLIKPDGSESATCRALKEVLADG
jgi:hypothetical protein